MPRDLFGLPIQVVATVATSLLPLKINDALFPIILDFALGNLSKHGIKRPHQGILEQVVTVGENSSLRCWYSETDPRPTELMSMRGLAEILEDGAIFADGEERPASTRSSLLRDIAQVTKISCTPTIVSALHRRASVPRYIS